MIQVLLYPPGEIFSRLLGHTNPIILPWVAGCHLIICDVFHKPTSSFSFSLLGFQQLRSTLLLNMLFKIIWGRRYCFLLHSFHSKLSFLPEALWCCSFHPSSRFVKDHVLFMPIHLTRVLCHFAQVLFALSSLSSLFNRSAVWDLSYPLVPFFQ